MSFSICVKCRQIVPAYEKYCYQCIDKYHLVQDENFHKRVNLSLGDYNSEFQKDLKNVKHS